MKFKQLIQLIEELTSVQKNEVDSWGPNTRATEISKHVFPEGHDRIEIPLEQPSEKKVDPHPFVADHLKKHGYEVKDYSTGLATDKHGRDVKIGKALEKTKASDIVKMSYINDPNRATIKPASNLKVVISKHPHDVAGMSTDRGWNSCMNMKGGCNRHYLKRDVQHGTHVAYLVHKDDSDIKKPLARIALKPYEGEDYNHTILRPESEAYGNADSAFHHTVNKFAEKHYPGKEAMYNKNSLVYNDSGHTRIVGNIDKAIEHEDSDVHRMVARSPNLTKEHIDKLIDKHGAKHVLTGHPNLTKEHIDKLINDPAADIRGNMAYRKDLSKEHIDKLINDDSYYVKAAIAEHPNLTKAHINKLIDDPDREVRQLISGRDDLTKEHLDKLIDNSGRHIPHVLVNHPNLTKEHLIKILGKSINTDKAADRLRDEHNISDEEINKILSKKHVQV